MKTEMTTYSQTVLTDMLKAEIDLINRDGEQTVTVTFELNFNVNEPLTLEQVEKLSYNLDAIGSRADRIRDEVDLSRYE